MFFKGDLRNKKLVFDILVNLKIKRDDAVIHFAGLKSVEESLDKPLKYWDSNVNTTLSLLEIMDDFECNSIVFSSSATIYKSNEHFKLTEDSIKEPTNPYGHNKLTIERILEDLFISNPKKWRIANLRYFNPVGAHESGYIGENPQIKPTNLFPILLDVAKNKKKNYVYLVMIGQQRMALA